MKKCYLQIIVLIFGCSQMIGQVTVTNATFPTAGDTLRTSTDLFFSDFDPNVVGADQSWDFTGLQVGTVTETLYLDAAEGPDAGSFPDADLYQPSVAFQDIYYSVSNNRIVEIGRAGLDPIFGAVAFDAEVDGNATFRRAPLAFGDTYDDDYGFSIELPVTALPDSIANVFGGVVTDLRVRVDFLVDDEVDAWGTLSLPSSDHEVLRLKRTTTTTINVEVKFIGIWVPLLELPVPIPEDILALVAPTVVTNYIFMSDTDKEEVANVTVDSTGIVLGTTFKVDGLVSSVQQTNYSNVEVVAFPNPTYGDVKFEFRNMPADRYTVDIYDVLGRKVWGQTSRIGQQRLDADLSNLRRGTYLYRVYDSKGHKLATKRLMIIRP